MNLRYHVELAEVSIERNLWTMGLMSVGVLAFIFAEVLDFLCFQFTRVPSPPCSAS
jgi:hypothetical protein